MSDDTPSRVRVLVVDDSRIVRRLLEKRLAEQPEFEVLPGAASGTEAIERIEALRPDVVTLDVTMPDMDGIEVLRRVRGRHPDTAFIMFSALTQVGATATVEGTPGGSIKAVYSRTRRPRDQLNSTSTLIKGSLTDLDDVIFT